MIIKKTLLKFKFFVWIHGLHMRRTCVSLTYEGTYQICRNMRLYTEKHSTHTADTYTAELLPVVYLFSYSKQKISFFCIMYRLDRKNGQESSCTSVLYGAIFCFFLNIVYYLYSSKGRYIHECLRLGYWNLTL